MSKMNSKTKKIIAATSVTIFSLLTLTLGAFAWFASSLSHIQNDIDFQVTSLGDCSLADIELYKFIYPVNAVTGDYDYLDPEHGHVNKYEFNDTYEHFGYYDDVAQTHWVNVTEMNIYDPIQLIISTGTLRDLHCNAIYEIALHSSSFRNATVDVSSLLRTDKIPGQHEILLSDCVDFDLYSAVDLSDTNPLFYDSETGQYNKYYPSYKNVLTDNEKVFHKIAYLSSLEASHPHFYGTNPKASSINIAHRSLTFDNNGDLLIYINANYAPSELEQYMKDIYSNNIRAIYDFSFEILCIKEEA